MLSSAKNPYGLFGAHYPLGRSNEYVSAHGYRFTGSSTFTLVADRCYFVHMYFPLAVTIDGLYCYILTPQAGSTTRIGYYECLDGDTVGTKKQDATIDATTSGEKTITFASEVLHGNYLFAFMSTHALVLESRNNDCQMGQGFYRVAAAGDDCRTAYYDDITPGWGSLPNSPTYDGAIELGTGNNTAVDGIGVILV